jgi:hypothetical protein
MLPAAFLKQQLYNFSLNLNQEKNVLFLQLHYIFKIEFEMKSLKLICARVSKSQHYLNL